MKGESGSVDMIQLKTVIKEGKYLPKQVLNVDETGIFWKRLQKGLSLQKLKNHILVINLAKIKLRFYQEMQKARKVLRRLESMRWTLRGCAATRPVA